MPAHRSSAGRALPARRRRLRRLFAVLAFVDLPFVFARCSASWSPPACTLARPHRALSAVARRAHVSARDAVARRESEGFVGVALWRITAIGLGVVLGTGAQLFLWPDDPSTSCGASWSRRLDLVHALADQAIDDPRSRTRPRRRRRCWRSATSRAELQLLANAEVRHPRSGPPRPPHRPHPRGRAALHLGALGGGDRRPRRRGWDSTPAVRARLGAISDESARLARALESRRGLLGSTGPTAVIPAEAGAGPARLRPAPVLDGMERSLGRIAFLTGAPRPDGASRRAAGA